MAIKRKAPWDKPAPKKRKRATKLTSAQKSTARKRASKAGRHYPNLVDNMAVAAKSGRKKASKKAARKKASKKTARKKA